MSKFAKLFERDGEQVLVISTQTDEGEPCLHFMLDIGNAKVEPKFTFKTGEWDKLDSAFDLVDENSSFSLRDSLVKQYGDKL